MKAYFPFSNWEIRLIEGHECWEIELRSELFIARNCSPVPVNSSTQKDMLKGWKLPRSVPGFPFVADIDTRIEGGTSDAY